MIAIIDYGAGNLFSLASSLRYLGFEAKITSEAADLRSAQRLILPGVGAFGDAMDKLTATGLIPEIQAQVAGGKPLLGICLGMQMLFEESYEFGHHAGLGLLKGSVRDMTPDLRAGGFDYKVPQIGWNSLQICKPDCPLLKYTAEGDFVYYVHSFYATDCGDSLAAGSDYGVFVPGAVWKDNVFGTQFHPEKSGRVGLDMLRAFCEVEA